MARPGGIRLPATLDRAEVSGVVAVCLDASASADRVRCDVSAVEDARLPAVEAIARIALAVRRDRRSFRLEHATPELIALLDLCGLADCMAADDEDDPRPP